ncbi:MAG: hypothetical protein QXX87_03470 [Candidatus Jordarchaeales archaeon]
MSSSYFHAGNTRKRDEFDPHFERLMARLGMSFRCSVCGRRHESDWNACYGKAIKIIDQYLLMENVLQMITCVRKLKEMGESEGDNPAGNFWSIFNPLSQRVAPVLLRGVAGLNVAIKVASEVAAEYAASFGVKAEELVSYLEDPWRFRENFLSNAIIDFTLLVDLPSMVNLVKKYAEVVEAVNKRILEAVEALPEARVEEVKRSKNGYISMVKFGGLTLPSKVIIKCIFPSVFEADLPVRRVSLLQVDEGLKHAVVWRSLGKRKQVKKGWLLVSRSRVVAELSKEEAKLDISTLVSKYLRSERVQGECL